MSEDEMTNRLSDILARVDPEGLPEHEAARAAALQHPCRCKDCPRHGWEFCPRSSAEEGQARAEERCEALPMKPCPRCEGSKLFECPDCEGTGAVLDIDAALAEVLEALEDSQSSAADYEHDVEQAEAEVERLRGYVRMALDELGVPGEGYPANIANAVDFLNECLKPDLARRVEEER